MFAVKHKTSPVETHYPAISWDESACPLCFGRNWSPVIEAQEPHHGSEGLWFPVVQCDSCGTCFTNPRPDTASLERHYVDSATEEPGLGDTALGRNWELLRNQRRSPRPEISSIPRRGEGRLLDVGCGNGGYIQWMRRAGWQATGIDDSPEMVDHVRDKLNLPAYLGGLPVLDLEHESFDVVTMWYSLQRAQDPLGMLREARKLLAPGGKLYVAVPNIDSWPFRWFGRHWCGLELPRHLTHFTSVSLPQMLQRSGFKVESVRCLSRVARMRESARRASRQRNSAPWQALLCRLVPAALATWWCHFAEQSDAMLAVARR
jgi:SAM-dependent methyltransferase